MYQGIRWWAKIPWSWGLGVHKQESILRIENEKMQEILLDTQVTHHASFLTLATW
jgi:hypothetical protein